MPTPEHSLITYCAEPDISMQTLCKQAKTLTCILCQTKYIALEGGAQILALSANCCAFEYMIYDLKWQNVKQHQTFMQLI